MMARVRSARVSLATAMAAGITIGIVGWVPAPAAAQQMPRSDACIECHLDLDADRLVAPALTYGDDVHAAAGFGCLSCHGAVPPAHGTDQPGPAVGLMVRPAPEQVPALCGSCHSDIQFMKQYNPSLRVDQVAEYRTSGHGIALARGDTAVATCISCHPAHSIRPPSDPTSSVYPTRVADLCGSCHGDATLMASRGLPTDQLELYRVSVHGRQMYENEDVSAPTCNDCHGNHGASPPGVAAVDQVCGQCHSMVADQFAASGHETPFVDAGMPGCSACHGNHAIEATADADLAVRGREVCARCHEPGETGAVTFTGMLALIDSLQVQADEARTLLARAENLGMEVSRAQFELDDATNAVTRARSAIHTFSLKPVRAEIHEGLAIVELARTRGEASLWEHGYRRIGLAGSAGFILLLVIGLILKIRELERVSASTPRSPSPDPDKPHARV